AKEILRLKAKLNEIMQKHTGQPLDRIEKDTDRDYFMGAGEAKEYGLIDEVVLKKPAGVPKQSYIRGTWSKSARTTRSAARSAGSRRKRSRSSSRGLRSTSATSASASATTSSRRRSTR